MTNDCIEYSTMLATWGATLGTWAAVVAACFAAWFAARAYNTQKDQLDDARKAAAEENQLRRFRVSPFFVPEPKAPPRVASLKDTAEDIWRNVQTLALVDMRNEDLAKVTAEEEGSQHTTGIEITDSKQRCGAYHLYYLRYLLKPDALFEEDGFDVRVTFLTANGYEDSHVYRHQFGTNSFERISPSHVSLHRDS